MQTKRPGAPAIINKWDRYLLLHHPQTWTARTHLVFYYGLLYFVALTALSYAVPDDPRTSSNTFLWVCFVSLISFIGFIVWLIYLLRFNVFKRYGLTSPVDRVKTFLLLFLATAIFAFFPYVQPWIESARANSAYPDPMVTNDINTLNKGIMQLEYDSLNHTWDRDTLTVSASVIETDEPPAILPDDIAATSTIDIERPPVQWRNGKKLIGKKQLASRLAAADSILRLNDSVYIFLECPNYQFVDAYRDSELKPRPLRSAAIYRQVLKQGGHPADVAQLRREVNRLISKYRVDQLNSLVTSDTSLRSRINRRYYIDDIQSSMYNLISRKKRWSADNIPTAWRSFIYISLVLSLLVFVFRHSTVKTFFLALLTAVVLLILTVLSQLFSEHTNYAFYDWLIFYFLLFLGISITTFYARKRSPVSGIAINLFVLLLPFIPLIVVADYYEHKKARVGWISTLYSNQGRYMAIAEWVGLALLLVLLATYIHRLYRRWYASPEE